MTATRGLVSRAGSWPAELLRERYGVECRTVNNLAKVLEAVRGYDTRDPITATQVGYTPTRTPRHLCPSQEPRWPANRIIREFMPNITANDADTVNAFNTEVIPILQATGAVVLESVNARDIAKGWAVDDPAIPNIDIQSIVATMIPILEPSLFNANTSASAPLTPDLTGGTLLPNSLRETITPISTSLYPAGTDLILKTVDAVTGVSPITDEINLRKLNNGSRGPSMKGALASSSCSVVATMLGSNRYWT